MFHKSKLHPYEHQFPHDRKGYVPGPVDHWSDMDFEHEGMDPHEAGISAEEQARRTLYLNTEWWPQVLKRVAEERRRLEEEHGDTFMSHWKGIAHETPENPHGFGVGVE